MTAPDGPIRAGPPHRYKKVEISRSLVDNTETSETSQQEKPRLAALAQPVEHRIRNAGVACSSHAGGTINPRQFCGFIGERPTSCDDALRNSRDDARLDLAGTVASCAQHS